MARLRYFPFWTRQRLRFECFVSGHDWITVATVKAKAIGLEEETFCWHCLKGLR